MGFLLKLGFFSTLLYLITMGGILIWPLINLFAFLKVYLFPSKIRKKYGVELATIDFHDEITNEDKNEIIQYKNAIKIEKNEMENKIKIIRNQFSKEINSIKEELANKEKTLQSLNPHSLSKNVDGSFSQKSKDGKKAVILVNEIGQIKTHLNDKNHKLNKEIAKITQINNVYQTDLETKIKNINGKPNVSWLMWKGRLQRYIANRDSLIFMLFAFPIFFVILSFSNLNNGSLTFLSVTEIYVYNVFVGPILTYFELSSFKGMFSLLISYEYAVYLDKNYKNFFDFYTWAIVTLPMPFLTLSVFFISYQRQFKKAELVNPNKIGRKNRILKQDVKINKDLVHEIKETVEITQEKENSKEDPTKNVVSTVSLNLSKNKFWEVFNFKLHIILTIVTSIIGTIIIGIFESNIVNFLIISVFFILFLTLFYRLIVKLFKLISSKF